MCLMSIPVHPHAGGEHYVSSNSFVAATGSSPRGWGTRVRFLSVVSQWRFIPTRVGNTAGDVVIPLMAAVHPHAGGEHHVLRLQDRRTDGSSPRGWGTRCAQRIDTRRSRFIPTRVGNTAPFIISLRSVVVHPHAGGEHVFQCDTKCRQHGSSPRGWGTPLRRTIKEGRPRFIPTRVGNTRLR